MKIYLNIVKIIVFFFILCSISNKSYAQYNVSNGDTKDDFTMVFTKEYLEIAEGQSFFNILKIINNSSNRTTNKLQFNIPPGWSFFGEETRTLTFAPYDTIFIPIRGSATQQVLGEIGYSIIATLSDRMGRPLLNAYTFIKIPKEKAFKFTPISRAIYFNQETKMANIQFKLTNNGNVDELVSLMFKTADNISIDGEVNNILILEVLIPPKNDSLFTYSVKLDKSEIGRKTYRVDLQVTTEESKVSSIFWIEDLVSLYSYEIPDNEKPLIIEVGAQNLFQESKPYFSATLTGKLLLKKEKDIFYEFRNHKLKNDKYFLQYSRISAGYNSKRLLLKLGDYMGYELYNQNAKGGLFEYNLYKGFYMGSMISTLINQFTNNYGISFKNLNPNVKLKSYFTYTENNDINLNSTLGYINGNFKLFKNHKFEVALGLNNLYFNNINKTGYYYRFNYSASAKKINWSFRTDYGSKYYYGRYSGRNNMNTQVNFLINKFENINIKYSINNNFPVTYIGDSINDTKFSLTHMARIRYTKRFPTGITIFSGPVYTQQQANSYLYYDKDIPFTVNNMGFLAGFSIGSGKKVLSPFFTTSYAKVSQFDPNYKNLSSDYIKEYSNNFNTIFTIRANYNSFGAFLNYYYGPNTIRQQFEYFYASSYYQSLRIMPYYEGFIYKDIFKISFRGSYLNEIIRKTQRINTFIELAAILKNGFTFSLLNTINYQRSLLINDEIYKYNSSYFEFRIKKDFEWNQPRYKYYNLMVIFYKDLNGNLKKDENEPGINNILFEIKRLDESKSDEYQSDFEYQGQFYNTSLLSNMYGEVSYKNIIKGFYYVNFKNVGTSRGNFSSKETSFMIEMNEDKTIYIPFLEHNKIFGKIILNRSKLSNLGKVDVSNVRVKAIDSQGNETSTLTDKNGNFVIYAPSVDRYIVSINNIFYEHFDLQQNNFLVQLNGYKQFEVNFVFSEKRREINFVPSFGEEAFTIKTIKRTNLTGTIKDENTLEPLISKVEIIDNITGESINIMHSDRKTGKYSISFITGPNYSIAVTKEGYWYHTEKLNLDQLTTIQDIRKDILLKNITINSKIELKNLTFRSGGSEIPTEAYPELDRLASQLILNPNIQIQIIGHADALEILDNDKISEERAKAVTKYFIEKGYSNINYVGYKDKNPVATNDTEAGRAQNRRVEIVIIDK